MNIKNIYIPDKINQRSHSVQGPCLATGRLPTKKHRRASARRCNGCPGHRAPPQPPDTRRKPANTNQKPAGASRESTAARRNITDSLPKATDGLLKAADGPLKGYRPATVVSAQPAGKFVSASAGAYSTTRRHAAPPHTTQGPGARPARSREMAPAWAGPEYRRSVRPRPSNSNAVAASGLAGRYRVACAWAEWGTQRRTRRALPGRAAKNMALASLPSAASPQGALGSGPASPASRPEGPTANFHASPLTERATGSGHTRPAGWLGRQPRVGPSLLQARSQPSPHHPAPRTGPAGAAGTVAGRAGLRHGAM
jgi:hypothetical protein